MRKSPNCLRSSCGVGARASYFRPCTECMDDTGLVGANVIWKFRDMVSLELSLDYMFESEVYADISAARLGIGDLDQFPVRLTAR